MTVERISLLFLALIAVVMGANYVSATGRFLDANRAYDSLSLNLESFTYESPESPVYVNIGVENPAGTAIEVLGVRLTLRAGIQQVGGGEIAVNEILQPGATASYQVAGRIDDVNVVRRYEEGEQINWLIRGAIRVRLDEDVRPVWIQFSVRTVSP